MDIKVNVLDEYEDLVGKSIVCCLTGLYDGPMFVTSNEELVMIPSSCTSCGADIPLTSKEDILHYLENSSDFQEQLAELGLINLEEYQEQLKKETSKEMNDMKKFIKERDLIEYERIKNLYNL